MKKLTFGLIPVALLTFSSCSTDTDDTITTVEYPTVNLVTPHDGGEVFASEGSYSFYLNITQGTASVWTKNLRIDNSDHSFKTDTVACYSYLFKEGELIKILNTKGYFDGNKNMPLQNANFRITSLFYNTNIQTPGYGVSQYPYPRVLAQYSAANWDVVTFPTDASYLGTTVTNFEKEGVAQRYENKDMLYRIVIDIEKKKATAIIYNAKFAEAAPSLTGIIIEGLTFRCVPGGYIVEGKNVVPSIIEGNTSTPNERFVFESFSFQTTNRELTNASISYDVAGGYHGSFSGSYLLDGVLTM